MSDIPTTQTVMRTVKCAMPDRSFIIAEVGLRKLDSNAQSYWSVTGELYDAHGTWSGEARHRNEREPDTCGAIQDEILRAFPHLAPIVALHMSDPAGMPMHAVANGRYYLERAMWKAAVRHFRTEELPAPQDVETFVDAQRDRWRAESEAAYALLLEL